MSIKFRSLASAALCASAVLALSGCYVEDLLRSYLDGGDATRVMQQAENAVAVQIQTIRLSDATIRKNLPGRATAYQVSEVRPQVNGIILKRLFEEGDMVKEGQPLYKIDPALYQASVDSAKATLKQAEATQNLRRIEAARTSKLVKSKAISQSEDDTAQAQYQVAIADTAAAKAAVTTAEVNLNYTDVRSPISGRVSLSEVTPGALVTANQSQRLTVVQQLDPIYVDVTESQIRLAELRKQVAEGRIKQDEALTTTCEVIFDDNTVYEHKGKLTFTDELVGESTGTVRIRALFPNPDLKLVPGMYIRARLVSGVREKVVKLDQRATMRNIDGSPYVYVVTNDNRVERRDVVLNGTDGAYWIVEKGLSEGDRVIVEGTLKVRPKTLVRTTEVGEQPSRVTTQH